MQGLARAGHTAYWIKSPGNKDGPIHGLLKGEWQTQSRFLLRITSLFPAPLYSRSREGHVLGFVVHLGCVRTTLEQQRWAGCCRRGCFFSFSSDLFSKRSGWKARLDLTDLHIFLVHIFLQNNFNFGQELPPETFFFSRALGLGDPARDVTMAQETSPVLLDD